jgi:DNA-binding transcriptional regulator YbjK
MATDRRTLIADAIIETLARVGSRGLTHRAVDETAGLPPGSTSYYLRTRASLLEAAVGRLAELDSAAVAPLEGRPLALVLSQVLDQLLTSDRARLLARYELSLEAVRRPELRHLLATGTRQVRDVICARLTEQGVADPDRIAGDVLAMLDGLLFAEVTATHGPARSREQLRHSIERVLVSPPRRRAAP